MNDGLKNGLTDQYSNNLLQDLKSLIVQSRKQALVSINIALWLTYWHFGKRINDELLYGDRAEYRNQIINSLERELVSQLNWINIRVYLCESVVSTTFAPFAC